MLCEKLKEYMARMYDLNHAVKLLEWDLKTKAPKNAVNAHAAAIATLSTESFKMTISDEIEQFVQAFEKNEMLDQVLKASLRELKKNYDRYKSLPEKLYNEYTEYTVRSEMVWEKAKRENDFKSFQPYLEKLVEYNKKMAPYIDESKGVYDILLDNYDTGLSAERIERLFDDLKQGLMPLLQKIGQKERFDDAKFFGHFSIERQKELSYYMLKAIGYDFNSGRLDESEHPFSTGTAPYDVRVTTHYNEKDIRTSLFTVLHEGGHALYEQNISPDLIKTPLAEGTCMSIHESQSRFYENIIGRNINFWGHYYHGIQQLFPEFEGISLETFHRGINIVEPSFIRVDADELTYNFHVILRFEIEKALFEGDLKVADLRGAWQEKMQKYLGVIPPTDAEGVLQDCHWAGGAFGYFPSYALGNIYGAQFAQQMEKKAGKLDHLLQEEKLSVITNWLKTNIHQFGKMKSANQLIHDICKNDLQVDPLITYYQNKYHMLYSL